MKNILLSDYDQTFFVNEDQVKRNIEIIEEFRDKDGCFALVTGRRFDSIKEQTEKYGIPYDYLSCVDGSTLFDSTDYLVKDYLMNEDVCCLMKEILDEKTDVEMVIYREESAKCQHNNVIQCFYDVTNFEDDRVERLYRTVKEVVDYYEMHCKVLDFSVDKFIIINSGCTDKSVAGRDIAEFEGIDLSHVYAIGDQCNDIEMVKAFNGYAMRHAIKDLKKISNGIYDSVGELAQDIMSRKLVR